MQFPLSSRVWTSAFAHRNPPRSLWLQHIHRMCCLTRRAHTAVPPSAYFEGIHGVRFAWGNTRLSHRKVSFTHYATRSRAKKSTLARSLVLFIKFGARFLASLRLAFRLQTSVELEQFFKSIDILFALLHVFLSEKLAQIQNQAVDFVADI